MVGGNTLARSITITVVLFMLIVNSYLLLDSSVHLRSWLISVSDLTHNMVSSANHSLLIFLPPVTIPSFHSWSAFLNTALLYMLKRIGERMHPRWTPSVGWNVSNNVSSTLIAALDFMYI